VESVELRAGSGSGLRSPPQRNACSHRRICLLSHFSRRSKVDLPASRTPDSVLFNKLGIKEINDF